LTSVDFAHTSMMDRRAIVNLGANVAVDFFTVDREIRVAAFSYILVSTLRGVPRVIAPETGDT
jgi:hypothetical protein